MSLQFQHIFAEQFEFVPDLGERLILADRPGCAKVAAPKLPLAEAAGAASCCVEFGRIRSSDSAITSQCVSR